MKLLEKIPIALLAVIVNALLFLLIPVLQIAFGSVPVREKPSEKVVAVLEPVVHKPSKQLEKKEYRAIKSLIKSSRPSSPIARSVKLDLSVVSGGEGVAIETGQLGVMTYLPGETDTDPEKISGLREPKMPLRAKREEVDGYVDALWVVNQSGFAVEIDVLKEDPPGYGFSREVIKYLKSLRYKPATLKNVPVRFKYKQRFRFEVR